MTNRTFDILRTLCEVVLPAVSALYVGLAQIWSFPMAEQIAGTIAVLITFLGAFLNVKRKSYNDLLSSVDE